MLHQPAARARDRPAPSLPRAWQHAAAAVPPAMPRVTDAPNLAIATLWCDQLRAAGFDASVQRAFASGIVGHIPPDQALPEVWVTDRAQVDAARDLLLAWQRLPERRWRCRRCDELVEGPFEQCWNCGADRPADPA